MGHSEAAEQLSKNLGSTLFSQSRDIILFIRLKDGRILEANPSAERAYGYSRAELLELSITDLRVPETRDQVGSQMQQANTSGILFETRHRRKDGTIFSVEVSSGGAEFRKERANLSIIRDITERKQVMEALRDSEEKFSRVFRDAPVWIAITDMRDATLVDMNEQAFRDTGFSREEVIGHNAVEIGWVREEDTSQLVREIQDHGRFVDLEMKFHAKDGRPLQGLVNGELITIGGRPCLLTVTVDITDRKRMEESLRESESRFRNFVEQAPVAIGISRNGIGLYANPKFLELFGLQRFEETIGRPVSEYLAPQYLEETKERLQLHSFGIPGPVEFESIALRADGSQFPVYVAVSQVHLSDGVVDMVFVTDLTERKRAEELLELLKYTIDISPDGAYWLNPDGLFLYINEGGCKALGYSQDELLKMRVFDINPRATPQRWAEVWQIIKDKKVFTIESVHRRKDGTEYPVEITSTYVKFGELEYCNGFARDITERKRTELSLQESLAQFRAVVQTANEAIIMINTRGTIIFWNPAAETIFGYSAEQAIGMPAYRIVPEQYREAMQRGFEQVMVNNERKIIGKTVEVAGQAKDGREFPIEMSLAEWKTEAGQFFTAIIRDISERKQVEETLRASEASLKFSQRVAHVGHWSWNTITNKVSWSDEMYRIFGLDPANFDGDLTKIIAQAIHPDDRDKVNNSNNAVLTEQKPTPLEYRVIWPDHSVHTVWAEAGGKILDENGKIVQLNGVVQDISERKQAEEEIRKLNAELEQRVQQRTAELQAVNRELEAFSYSVSHDLRAPLRTLDGFSGALLADYQSQLDQQGKHYLTHIQNASRQMGQLIDDLLNLSRIARHEVKLEQVNLGILARRIADELQTAAPERRMEFDIPVSLIVHGDPRLIKIALENLIQNAFKFTSRRELAHIQLGMLEQGGERIYFVRDNGVGFDMAYAGKLFTPFQRLHGTSEYPGTGIGLTIVQRIITRHGGRIWPEAKVNQGATFFFTLAD